MKPIEIIRKEQERVKRHGTALERIRRGKEIKRKISEFFERLGKAYLNLFFIVWVLCVSYLPILLVIALSKYLGE